MTSTALSAATAPVVSRRADRALWGLHPAGPVPRPGRRDARRRGVPPKEDGAYDRILKKWGTTESAIETSEISPPELK